MTAQPTDSLSTGERATAVGGFVAVALLAVVNLFVIGWFVPATVTRTESTSGFRAFVGEVFGNAPTAGRVFVGRVR